MVPPIAELLATYMHPLMESEAIATGSPPSAAGGVIVFTTLLLLDITEIDRCNHDASGV